MKKINWAAVKSNGGKVVKKILIVTGSVLGAVLLTKAVTSKKNQYTVIEEGFEPEVDNSVNDIKE